MQTALIAIAAALLVAQDRPVTPKPAPIDVGAGRIAWFDITTSNLSRARDFYGSLFGWTFAAVQGSDQALTIVASGTRIGTIRVAEGQISVSNGVVYVQVPDVQAASRKAKELGGTVPPGFPFNLPDGTGAVGLAIDPAGHPIGFYSNVLLPPVKPPFPF